MQHLVLWMVSGVVGIDDHLQLFVVMVQADELDQTRMEISTIERKFLLKVSLESEML